MEKVIKYIVLVLSLALVAGLFVCIFTHPKVDAPLVDEKLNENNQEKETEPNLSESTPITPNHLWTKESLAKEIAGTTEFVQKDDSVYLFFIKPSNTGSFFISVQAEIFDDSGKSISSFLSDNNTEFQNAANNEIEYSFSMNIQSLKNKLAIAAIRVFDAEKKETPVIYQLVVNFDGNKVWNNNLESRGE
ncbi:MAG: hypothetical protein MJ150_00785 [Clostridia bacterium]|nr:hypothetical protein [Clostridia bacterium]